MILGALCSNGTQEELECFWPLGYGSFVVECRERLVSRDVRREKARVSRTLVKKAGVAGRQAQMTVNTGSRLAKIKAGDVTSMNSVKKALNIPPGDFEV